MYIYDYMTTESDRDGQIRVYEAPSEVDACREGRKGLSVRYSVDAHKASINQVQNLIRTSICGPYKN